MLSIVKEVVFLSCFFALLVAGTIARFATAGLWIFDLSAEVSLVTVIVFALVWSKDKNRNRICRVFLLIIVSMRLLGSLTVWDGVESKIWVVEGKIGKERKTPFAIPYLHDIRNMSKVIHVSQNLVTKTRDGKTIQGTATLSLFVVASDEAIKSILRRLPDADLQIIDEAKRLLTQRFDEVVQGYDLSELENDLIFELEIGDKLTDRGPVMRSLEWAWVVKVSELRLCFISDRNTVL